MRSHTLPPLSSNPSPRPEVQDEKPPGRGTRMGEKGRRAGDLEPDDLATFRWRPTFPKRSKAHKRSVDAGARGTGRVGRLPPTIPPGRKSHFGRRGTPSGAIHSVLRGQAHA